MKNGIKVVLSKVGLLAAGRVVYSFVKGLSPLAIQTEIRSRWGENEIPVPPSRLIFLVIGHRYVKTFLDSGRIIVQVMVDQFRSKSIELSGFASILDFGCGCGRLIRHLPSLTNAKLYGCDYNPELIEWSQQNLPFAAFTINSLAPPLPYSSELFDMIYARSIFTHLDEPLQKKWITELRRVLKPGGYLYFTTHGEQFFDRLSSKEQELVRGGKLIVFEPNVEGHNICSSFELESYIRQNLMEGFAFIDYLPGKPTTHLQQDAYILKRVEH